MNAPAPRHPSADGWRSSRTGRLFLGICLLNLAFIAALVVTGRGFVQKHGKAIDAHLEWTERQALYARLDDLAGDVDAPGNDVFASRDVARERRRLDDAVAAFVRGADEAARSTSDGADAGIVLVHLRGLRAHTERTGSLGSQVLSALSQEPPDEALAARKMAEMDRAFADARAASRAIRAEVRALRETQLHEEHAEAKRLRDQMRMLVLAVVLTVLGSTAFATSVTTSMRRAAVAREDAMRAAEEATKTAQAANAAKSEFLANMSHEIRTPMTAIMGFSDLLIDPHVGIEERLTHVQAIRRNGEHLLGVLNDILDLSKVEAGRLEIELVRTGVNEIVAEIVSLMQVRAAASRSELHVRFATPIPSHVETDPTRLRQILVNLVGNALKFTTEGTVRIVVSARSVDGEHELTFAVEDTGIGISQEQIGRLFQPFTQADTSMTRRYGGTGLGLVISKRLANMLGGDLLVRSSPGLGSTFTLTMRCRASASHTMLDGFALEVKAPPAGDKTSAPSGESLEALVGARVLLAEDGPDNQRLLGAILRKVGVDLTIVDNGKLAVDAALEALHNGAPFHVILMDMQMPVLDGYGAVTLLRSKGYTRPVVALTAHAMKSERDRCIRVGCDDFASKPIRRNELLTLIASHVRRSVVPRMSLVPGEISRRALENVAPLASALDDDPDLRALAADVISSLTHQLERIEAHLQSGQLALVATAAHQIRGAGGTAGYPTISDAAAALEKAADSGDAYSCATALARLEDLVARARAGLRRARNAA